MLRPDVAAGAGATPAAFYLGLCRLRGVLSPPAPHDHAAGGLFFDAATKIRIGRGKRCRNDRSRRNHSSLPQRKLELDAERCCGRDRCHSGGFLLRIMPPSWHPVPACTPTAMLQAGYSSVQQRWRCIDSQVWARNQESMHAKGCFRGKSCIDSQVWA